MRIEQLTFTRYIAALTVVFFHYGSSVFPANLPLIKPVLAAGPIAVSYFYVLSGFIMAIAYYRPQSKQPFDTKRYWVARLARIYPVYLLALLLMMAAKFKGAGSDLTTVTLSVSMLQAWIPGFPLTLNAPGWSLSVEAFFYLLFPLLILGIQRRSLLWLTLVTLSLWLLTQLVHTWLLNSPAYQAFSPLHDFIYYNPLMHVNTFLIGFLAGVWLQQGNGAWLHQPTFNHMALIMVSLAIVGTLGSREALMTATHVHFDYTNGLIAPLFIGLILLLALNTSSLKDILQHPWLILLGEASFSLYILQKPLHGIYEKLMPAWIAPDSALHFYLFIILLTGIALFSYWFFETPLRRFINNFVNR